MQSRKRIAHVSTFPPLKCGIASFASDLIIATSGFDHVRYALHYGDPRTVEASAGANANSPSALAGLAQLISAGDCDLVSLQHEFGIWGGREGENIHAFLDNLTKPLLTVLHTTFGPGVRSQGQADIVLRLIEQSAFIVVLTEASRETVESLCGGRIEHLAVVPHGIPDYPYVSPPAVWETGTGGSGSTIRLITPGFFREDKGVEMILHALRVLLDCGHRVSYLIAGESQQQFGGQAPYRARVENLIDSLRLGSAVQIDGRYLPLTQQASAIRAAHLGVFAYQDPSQASSGTVPLVMSMGRPVLCTPFEYAKAKAREGPGVFLATGFDSASIACAIEEFMQVDEYATLTIATYNRTRPWTWTAVGRAFRALYNDGRWHKP